MDKWSCLDCGASFDKGIFPYLVKTARDGNGFRCAACLTKMGRILCEPCDSWESPANICCRCKDEIDTIQEDTINKMEAQIVIYERALRIISEKKWNISPEYIAKGALNDAKEVE